MREYRVTALVTEEDRGRLERVAEAEHRTLSTCVWLAVIDWLAARERGAGAAA